VTYDEKEYILREIVATLSKIDNEEIRANLISLIFNLLSPINSGTSDYSNLAFKIIMHNIAIEI
jgi:hypothetical protein